MSAEPIGRNPQILDEIDESAEHAVLLIDDSHQVLAQLSGVFRKHKLSHYCTDGWHDYLNRVREMKREGKKLICITDLNMPAMSGEKILTFLFMIAPHATMILFSSAPLEAKKLQQKLNTEADKTVHAFGKGEIPKLMTFVQALVANLPDDDIQQPKSA